MNFTLTDFQWNLIRLVGPSISLTFLASTLFAFTYLIGNSVCRSFTRGIRNLVTVTAITNFVSVYAFPHLANGTVVDANYLKDGFQISLLVLIFVCSIVESICIGLSKSTTKDAKLPDQSRKAE